MAKLRAFRAASRSATVAALVATAAAFLLHPTAADSQSPPLITDRPDLTESPWAVPLGSVQVEAGSTRETADGVSTVSGLEALVRWSPLAGAEVRFELPGFVRGGPTEGTSDLRVGAKVELGSIGAWRAGAIGMLGLPTGSSETTTDGVEPEVIVALGRDLGPSWSLGLQASVLVPAREDGVGLASTVVVGRSLTGRTGAFLEVAGERVDAVRSALLHGGLTFSPHPRVQFDVHGYVGLNDAAPDRGIGLGASTRFR